MPSARYADIRANPFVARRAAARRYAPAFAWSFAV
jgi:hypothetical protein